MKRFFLLACLLGIFPVISYAQFDSIVNAFQKEFEQFKQSAIQNQQQFINHNDSVFINFLKGAWSETEVFQKGMEEKPKPVNQPIIGEDTLSYKMEYIPPKAIIPLPEEKKDTSLKKLPPANFNSQMLINRFNFYGQEESLYYSPQIKPCLRWINEEEIASFYQSLAQHSALWNYNLDLLTEARDKYALNDWGYYQLVKDAAQSIFENKNEQNLFCWYLLLKSGYNVKVGFDHDEIYLLIPSIQNLYNILYESENGHTFYIVDGTKTTINGFRTYQAEYPGSTRSFSFDLLQYPKVGGDTVSRTLHYNGQTIQLTFHQKDFDFLDTYPLCDLNVFFHSGISENNFEILDKLFRPLLLGKTDEQKVNLLLNFCQHALEYETDQEQFGRERYLFAEESLFYPYCDCEDRAILLAALVQRYTDLDAVALDFPGHVALAVHFNEDIKGTYVEYDGKKYMACDPTYINAVCGMLPVDFKNVKPEIISF